MDNPETKRKYYLKNKDEIIRKVRLWQKKNPEKWKKYAQKHIKTDKFKEAMKRTYQKNKGKWNSRRATLYLIKRGVIKLEIKCPHNKNLEIHHEVYPTKKKEIIKAINEDKIYYLCHECHKNEKRIS